MSGTYGQLVLDAHTALFDRGDTGVLDTAFSENFIEHSPLVAGDRDGLRTMVEGAGDAVGYTNARVLADGDLVALHGRFTGLDETDLVGFDIYRVADGKLVEHWDSLVPVAAPNPSGRTQLDGPVKVDSSVDSEASRATVTEFFTRTLIDRDYDGFRRYTRDGVFLQHSPDIADGVDAVIGYLEDLKAKGQGLVYDRIHRTVADGQFILTHSEGSVAGVRHSYAELWHLSDGVLTEMWDAVTEVPADAEALHDHGIF
ncbi:MAG: nuclear transport factor 2 family protein [Corynebacterium provencense]|jgi:predicted SnoaL-like aldol condensation-catalyzing enzyme|uniref:nuclear transport factor 2 family protein n=1 Tax=Corynebacterium provencense TaxID=1737425 RepID=UPI002989C4DA|nr:nuclear transport factor 2 family protein [Corynebacterium provencense]